jgi:hypothetical protein
MQWGVSIIADARKLVWYEGARWSLILHFAVSAFNEIPNRFYCIIYFGQLLFRSAGKVLCGLTGNYAA